MPDPQEQAPEPHSRQTPHGETPYSPMSLLRALTSNPLDVETLRGTEGRHEEAAPPDTAATKLFTTVAALALGFLVAISVADLRADAAAEDSPRALLAEEVRESRDQAAALETEQAELQGDVSALQEDVLGSTDAGAAAELGTAEAAAGSVALAGPGVVLQLDDSDQLPASPGVAEGTVNAVTDQDLQIAVNGLWAAGAEAVSVNGQRLTSTSAIRTAGDAVLVDLRPLSPPYRITALGDPDALRAGVEDSVAGEYLEEISLRFRIPVTWEASEELTVPARTVTGLREARPLDEADGTAAEPSAPAAATPDDGAAPDPTPEETP